MPDTLHHLRKYLTIRYLSLAGCIWKRIPASVRSIHLLTLYGAHLHSLVLRFADRRQNCSTFFLRNRAELELIRRIAARAAHGSSTNIAVFACSKGAEVYSIAWTLKVARPDLIINIHAIDISQNIIEFAKEGVYSLEDRVDQKTAADTVQLSQDTYRD